MNIIRFEIKRAFRSKSFMLGVGIGLVVSLLDFITFRSQYGTNSDKILIQAWIGTDYQFAYNSLFYVLLPLMACLPYGGTLFKDRREGYQKNICLKVARHHYIFAKALTVFLTAFVSVTLPLFANLIVTAGLYASRQPEKLYFLTAGIIDCNLFPILFNQYPVWYCVVYILVDGIFAGLLGLTSLLVSKWVNSYFAAVMVPFVIYILTGVLFVGEGVGTWSIMEMLNPVQRCVVFGHQVVIVGIGIVIINGIVLWYYAGKRDIL